MTVIEIKGLKKTFGETTVLNGIDCNVHLGSVHGFLGPNGSGKTTTIKTLLGLYKADAGEIRLFNEPINFGNMQPFLANIGYLPQDPVFPEQYTGFEVMELIANLYKIPTTEKILRIKELLKHFDLFNAGHRLVKNYSRGMKQRLGLATVWLPRPKLMILDEPVSALDPEGRYDVLEKIKEVKGESAVFFSSHILADVERVADQVTIIAHGQVLLASSIEDIRSKYESSTFSVKLPFEKLEQASLLLAQMPDILTVERAENQLVLQADQNKLESASKTALLKLLQADIPVLRFSLQEASLEDVFLQLTNGRGHYEANDTAGA